MKHWYAHFIGGPFNGKIELCRAETVEATLRAVGLREGEAFGARELTEDTTPIANAYVIHEYHAAASKMVGTFLHVTYRWAGEPKIPQVEGVL